MSKYSSIEYDSRKVQSGSLFVAIKGEKFDAHDYIEAAINKGARAIVFETKAKAKINTLIEKFSLQVDFQEVANTRIALAKLCYEFYEHSSDQLTIIAVTGTNGKTTVTHLIQDLISSRSKIALLGTMGLKLNSGADYQEMDRTTPQSKELFESLDKLVKDNYEYLTMEVSSHALDQYRVEGLKFKTAIVTNLTQDHLDYHLTMENYFQAKAKIFAQTTDNAILNMDDPFYDRFKAFASHLKVKSIGLNSGADYRATEIKFSSAGFEYILMPHNIKVCMKLNGMFNVYNSLAAIAAAELEGFSIEQIQARLKDIAVVAGRFELIKYDNHPACIVDYAHSPDGILNVLQGARALIKANPQGRLICVFGCGGDRDVSKRPKMGRIAYDLADLVYVTSDNPRSEDPEQIVADILTGIPEMSKVKVILDRKMAIKVAIESASDQDLIVIAGKGHENYQILKDQTIHFDDKEEILAVVLN